MTFLSICKWGKYQDRRDPHWPWLKLYVHVLDDKKVQSLPPLTRLLWYQLLPLAARYENAIPYNVVAISRETKLERHTVAKSIERLISVRMVRETAVARPALEIARRPPADLMAAFIQNGGYHLTDRSLVEEMEQRGVPEGQHEFLLELAHCYLEAA